MPLKAALKSPEREAVATGLRVLTLLARCCPEAGPALLPYYRQLLPPLNRRVGLGRAGRERGLRGRRPTAAGIWHGHLGGWVVGSK